MYDKFSWSHPVIAWIAAVVLTCSVISYNMPFHTKPNEIVLVPGYQFIEAAIYMFGASIVISAIRKRTFIINFDANWLEAFIALNGAALFVSPFIAILAKLIFSAR